MLKKIKEYFSKLFKINNDFNFIEKTEEETYIYHPSTNSKGIQFDKIEDLNKIIMYDRMAKFFPVATVFLVWVILVIVIHQFYNMDGLFSLSVVGFILGLMICGIIGKIKLSKLYNVEKKSKTKNDNILIIVSSIILIIVFALGIILFCPCVVFDNDINNENYQQASQKIDFFLKIEPKNKDLYFAKAIVMGCLGDYDSAIKSLDKIEKIKPELADIYSLKALVLFEQNGNKVTPEINSLFEKSLSLEKCINCKAMIYSDRGGMYFVSQNYDKAIKDYEKAYELSHNEYMNYTIGLSYEQKNDYDKAFAYFNTIPPKYAHEIRYLRLKREHAKNKAKKGD